jgi:hypothetical protein
MHISLAGGHLFDRFKLIWYKNMFIRFICIFIWLKHIYLLDHHVHLLYSYLLRVYLLG